MTLDLDPGTDLSFTRTLAVPRQLIWECWTDPKHIPHFFIPAPHKVTAVDIDLRVGGRFNTTFDVDGNVISYSYIPKFTEFHMIKPVQVNNKKKEMCGYVMLLKKTVADIRLPAQARLAVGAQRGACRPDHSRKPSPHDVCRHHRRDRSVRRPAGGRRCR